MLWLHLHEPSRENGLGKTHRMCFFTATFLLGLSWQIACIFAHPLYTAVTQTVIINGCIWKFAVEYWGAWDD